jgi:hypothetical protein
MPSTSIALQLDLFLAKHPLRLVSTQDSHGALTFAGTLDIDQDPDEFLRDLWLDLVGDTYPSSATSTKTKTEFDVFFASAPGAGSSSDPSKENDRITIFGLIFPSKISFLDPDPKRGIPLVGDLLGNIAISQFQIIYASRNVPALNLRLPASSSSDNTPKPDIIILTQPLTQGLSLAFTIDSADAQQTFAFQVWKPPQKLGEAAALASGEAPPDSGIKKWFDVQKMLGPLSIQRVGIEWKAGNIGLLLDAGVRLSILGIGLKGFALSFPLNIFSHFSLDQLKLELEGLDLAYQSGFLTIQGGFLRMDDGTGYAGDALIKVGNFSLSAIGEYTNVNGQPSVFLFAFVGIPIGGPPCFFVTGLAGGFGYNQSINLPAFDQVQNFPLVKFATGPDQLSGKLPKEQRDTCLTELKNIDLSTNKPYMEPALGRNWLAAGIRFTSFGMVNSFALLIVEFGKEFEISLLGLSQIRIPKTGDTNSPLALACAELGLQITFLPSEGIFRATASLTSNSYILDRACKLTGGFAFYVWFNQEHAGDFVITLGGYHPAYKPPAWYPNVPRLGFNWPQGDLAVSGGMYFALTPSCLMAGLSLSAVYQSAGLHAWFDAQADFIIAWEPLHYDAFIAIRIGVSYGPFTAELGVSLHIWGPPFCLTATIQWWVVSCTISAGDTTQPASSGIIGWDEFRRTSLVQSKSDENANEEETSFVWQARAQSGLIKQAENGTWLVRGDSFVFSLQTTIPASEIKFDGSAAVPIQGTTVGIRPMGCAQASTSVTITVQPMPSGERLDLKNWDQQKIQGGVPCALWGTTPLDPTKPPDSANEIIQNVLLGVQLRPGSEPLAGPAAIAIQDLASRESIETAPLPLDIDGDPARVNPPAAALQEDPVGAIQRSVMNDQTVALRHEILRAAVDRGLSVHPDDIHLGMLALQARKIFVTDPTIGRLGTSPLTVAA